MSVLATLLFLLGFVVVQPTGSLRAQSEGVIADPDSYDVFGAALSMRLRVERRTADRVAVLQETRPVSTCPDEQAVPPEWRSAAANYRKENTRIRMLRPDADLGRPYSLVSVAELRSLMRGAGYDLSKFAGEQSPGAAIFRAFPGGRLVAFSAVGFNEQKTRAIVTLQYDCFPSAENQPPFQYCHEFHQLKLEKREGRWVPAPEGECSGIA